MDNVKDVMSKFKDSLGNIISNVKDKISEIESEEEFIVTLGDVVNYCKSDSLLLPFYDEKILSSVFERVFPLSNIEMDKIKTAKYLIEASKSIDKSHFAQYNDSVKDLESICSKLVDFYDKLLSDNKLSADKEQYNLDIQKYSEIYNCIDDDKFNSLISNIDLFEECINVCELSDDEINIILNVAIKSNLVFLDSSGVVIEDSVDEISEMKKQNDIFQDEIADLSNLLGNEQEGSYGT